MFAVLSRFDPRVEEAARDLGASNLQSMRYIIIPILLPGIIAVALFGFTLSYDEFPRSTFTVGARNHAAAGNLEHDHQRHLAGALRARHRDDGNSPSSIILIALTAIGVIQARRQRAGRKRPGA